MFVEGKCYLNEFPEIIKNTILSESAWTMVSSNVGSSVDDDGYVFYSKGSDGTGDIFIGFNPYFNSESEWYKGYRFFMLNDYKPNDTMGQNGVKNTQYNQFLALFHYDGVYTAPTFPIRYWININKERLIIAVKPDTLHNYARNNVLYLGKPPFLFDPNDDGLVIASGIEMRTTTAYTSRNGTIAMTGGIMGLNYTDSVNSVTTMETKTNFSERNKIWGGKVFPSTILLFHSVGNFRAMLDVYILNDDGTLREIDNIKIDDVEYLAIRLEGKSTFRHAGNNGTYDHYNNFWKDANTRMHLLIPKL